MWVAKAAFLFSRFALLLSVEHMYTAPNPNTGVAHNAASNPYLYTQSQYYSAPQYSHYGYLHSDPYVSTPYGAAYQSPVSVMQHNPYSQPLLQSFGGNRVASISPVRAPVKTATPFAAAPIPAPAVANQVEQNRYSSVSQQSAHPAQHSPGHQHNQGQDSYAQAPVSTADLLLHVGQFEMLARTPTGSSFIQSALKEGCDPANVSIVWSELEPCFVDLLLDAHGCYVLKSLMERMDEVALQSVVHTIVRDEQLCFSMCTHSLHTRRVAQFLIEKDVSIMGHLLVSKCREIGMTQQGCIIMQKAMDLAVGQLKGQLFEAIITNFVDFALDPFANYIVQHLLEIGGQDFHPDSIVRAVDGSLCSLSCNKYASNVIEKCLFHLPSDAQHAMITEMYNVDEEVLFQMLQDSFGNYIIQSSIALANFRDIWMISEKLRNVLQRTPYGHKIEARLERRLKGKSVLSRGGTQHPGRGRQPQRSNRHHHEQPAQQHPEPW